MRDLECFSVIHQCKSPGRIRVFLRKGRMIHGVIISIKFLAAHQVIGVIEFVEMASRDGKLRVGDRSEVWSQGFNAFRSNLPLCSRMISNSLIHADRYTS